MFFKLLCTLCVLVGDNRPMKYPATRLINSDVIQFDVQVDTNIFRDLCNDFAPNITNSTCNNTLFATSEKLNFIRITDQMMQLKPTANDMNCYPGKTYQCFPLTYEINISAFNSSDHRLLKKKEFAITVTDRDITKIQIIVLSVAFLGALCVISCCCKKELCRGRQIVPL